MSKGQETRQRILAQAAGIFNQHGFEGSSMSELMKATGLEKGGIYRHFSSKEELAAEAFDYAWQAAQQARMHGVDALPNSVDRLKKFAANFIDRRSPVPGGCPLLNTAIDSDDGNAVLRARSLQSLEGWRGRIAALVEAGKLKQEIRPEVDANCLALLMISLLEGALMISRLQKKPDALQNARTHLDHYLEAQVRLSGIAD